MADSVRLVVAVRCEQCKQWKRIAIQNGIEFKIWNLDRIWLTLQLKILFNMQKNSIFSLLFGSWRSSHLHVFFSLVLELVCNLYRRRWWKRQIMSAFADHYFIFFCIFFSRLTWLSIYLPKLSSSTQFKLASVWLLILFVNFILLYFFYFTSSHFC